MIVPPIFFNIWAAIASLVMFWLLAVSVATGKAKLGAMTGPVNRRDQPTYFWITISINIIMLLIALAATFTKW